MKLEESNLCRCFQLSSLPDFNETLGSLRVLNLSWSVVESLVESFGGLGAGLVGRNLVVASNSFGALGYL